MTSNTVVKEEILRDDSLEDESLDDVADLISRAEAIIQENRERIRRNKRQNAERIREEAIAVLQACSPVIVCQEPVGKPPCTHEEQPISEPVQETSVDTCTPSEIDDDVIFVACVQPPNRAPLIDLSTPDTTNSDKHKSRRRRDRLENSYEDEVIAVHEYPVATSKTCSNLNSSIANTNSSCDSKNERNSPNKVTQLNTTCPICFETYSKPTSTICGHVFCEKCIKGAIKARNKCPMCNRKLNLKGIHPLFI